MSEVLARHVCARRAHMVPGERLDEVTTGPLEYGAGRQVDAASRFRFGMSDERHHHTLREAARDDVHVIREYRHLVDMDPPPDCRISDCRSHDVGVSAPEGALPQPRVPGDVHVQTEGSMGHWWLG